MRLAARMLVLLAAGLLLVGCINPYTKFYRGSPDGRQVEGYLPQSTPLEIYASSDLQRDIDVLERRGFMPIGESVFNAAQNRVSEGELREQATKLGAAAVLVSSRYTHTVSGAIPLIVPNNSTSYTTGTATVYGAGGTANVNGTATTTTYGSQTMLLPYQIRRADFDAVYFVKRRMHLGVMYSAIDAATRTRLQTNAGALIKLVVDGSPAAHADILPGDIILTFDGERVDGPEALNNQLKGSFGKEIALGIDRNGARIEKRLVLPP